MSGTSAQRSFQTVGTRVEGTYVDVPFAGTVSASRWHTISDYLLVTVELDTPTEINGSVRDRVMVSVGADGTDVTGCGDTVRVV
jgi:hypothetical protein